MRFDWFIAVAPVNGDGLKSGDDWKCWNGERLGGVAAWLAEGSRGEIIGRQADWQSRKGRQTRIL